jgi:hypothetical protein
VADPNAFKQIEQQIPQPVENNASPALTPRTSTALKDPRALPGFAAGMMFHDPVFNTPAPPAGNIGAVQPGSTVYSKPIGPNMGQVNSFTDKVKDPYANYNTGMTDNVDREKNNNDEDLGKFGYKVRLFAVRKFPTEHVIFEASPVLSEARTVEYAAVTPVHMPGSIQVYKRTNARTFSLTAKFVSRNREQATTNMKYLQLLRGWTMPYFGTRSATDGFTGSITAPPVGGHDPNASAVATRSNMLGAPPDVLYLYAYSNSYMSREDRGNEMNGRINIKKLPVVITNLSFDFPDDVDYIPVEGTNEPFPVKIDVRIELAETHSPHQYEDFSLSMFKKGQLVNF